MTGFLLVGLGGALGAMARYGAGLAAARLGAGDFPWGTLFVNVVGGLAMGVLAASAASADHGARQLLGAGVLGGFTTFSAFSIETVRLIEGGQADVALGYAVASVLLAVSACWIGVILARSAA
jgi:fluoride exporter